jgi:hypothetical protein
MPIMIGGKFYESEEAFEWKMMTEEERNKERTHTNILLIDKLYGIIHNLEKRVEKLEEVRND